MTTLPWSRLRSALLLSCALVLAPLVARAQFDALPPPPEEPAPAAAPVPAAAPAAAPVAAPAATTTAAPESAVTADEAFDQKTKVLEERVNDLKEKIVRTKYRIAILADTVLGSASTSGAKLALWHRNELGSSYVLVSAAYTLDGAPLYTKVDETGDLNEREEFVVFDQRIVPGQHQMAVRYELRGHGYGVFSYLEGLRLKLTASYAFNVEPGKITKVTSVVKEKEGITLEFKDKPDIQFEMNVQKEVARPEEEAAPQAAAGGAAK